MKHLLTITILLIIQINLFGQKWDHIFGTSGYKEACADILECYDKGYLISGWYEQLNGNWIIKTDFNGNLLWDKIIIHNEYGVVDGLIDHNNSGEFVIARCLNFPNGDQWPSVIKLDSCGNKVWCRVFVDDEYNSGCMQDVILFDNGDILALGYMQSLVNYNERIFLYYIDINGNLVWRQSYASKENHPLVLERIPDGIHQFENEFIINGWCAYPNPGSPATGYMRPFFIGIDNEFKEKWILPFGVDDSIIGSATNIIPLNDSVYMGTGFVWETGSEQNTIFMFIKSDGEELGYSQIYNDSIGSDIEDNVTSDIARLNDTLFITSTVFGSDEEMANYGEFIVDTAGNIFKKESRPNTEGISTIIKTFDDKYIIGCSYKQPNGRDIYLYKINDSLQMDTIYPGTYTYDSLCPYQIQSGIVDISDCMLITDVGEVPTPEEYFASIQTIHIKAYPNPTTDGEITLSLQNTEQHEEMELHCFNIFGQEVHTERVYPHQGETRINVQKWKSGIYLAVVYSDGKPVGRAKFIIQ